MTYGFCAYHEIECDYEGDCIVCPHNTKDDIKWFKQAEEKADHEKLNIKTKIYILRLTNNAGVSIDYEFSTNNDRRVFTVKVVNADRMSTISKIEFLEKMEVING